MDWRMDATIVMVLIALFTGRAQPVEMESVFTQCPATDLDKVVVVGKEKYLGALGQRGQLRENGGCPIIVEGDQ